MVEDLAAGQFDERALFHLLNLAREERAFVLLTARTAPGGWKLAIPDLASRLKALPVVALTAPDDVLLRGVLVKLFADRQLAVDESLVGFLAKRIERSIAGGARRGGRARPRGDAPAAPADPGAGGRVAALRAEPRSPDFGACRGAL